MYIYPSGNIDRFLPNLPMIIQRFLGVMCICYPPPPLYFISSISLHSLDAFRNSTGEISNEMRMIL